MKKILIQKKNKIIIIEKKIINVLIIFKVLNYDIRINEKIVIM
jgi:hypothetical protein